MNTIQAFKEAIALAFRLTMMPVIVRELLQRNRVTIIVYHRISAPLFEKHIRYLLKHYSVIPLHQFIEAKYSHNFKRLPKKAVIITFDDGARITYTLRDVIRRCSIPVTVFVCSDILGTRRHFWFSYIKKINANPKKIPDVYRLKLLSSVGFDEVRDYDVADSLSLNEVSDLLKIGISFQSHTATHPILPMCDDFKAETEIVKSKIDIENKLGVEVTCFAYPNGDYLPRDISICQRSGYMAAVTMEPGFNDADTDLYRLRRLSIDEHASVNQFAVKVSGVWAMTKGIFVGKRHIQSTAYITHHEAMGRTDEPVANELAKNTINMHSVGGPESQ